MNRLLLIAALVVGLPLAAAPKVVVLPFEGKKANAGRLQLVKELCDRVDCVPDAKVSKKGEVDWGKAKKEKISFVISGEMKGKKTEVSVQNAAKKNVMKKSYTVGPNGRFFAPSLKSLLDDLDDAVASGGGKEEREEKEEEAEPPPPPKKVVEKEEEEAEEEEEAAPPPPRKEEKRVVKREEEDIRERDRDEKPVVEEKEEEEETPSPRDYRGRPPLLIAEGGVAMGPRIFAYSDVQTANLRSYRAFFIFQPRVNVQLYPLARVLTGIPAGIGVEAGYQLAVGLQSSPTGGPNYPTQLSRLDVALRLRMQPIEDNLLVINPLIGYRMQNFTTSPAEDGSRLTGLADINYTAVRIGATVEQSIMDDDAAIIGELSVLPVLGTGALRDYFANSSGFGFEVGVGFAYTLMPRLQLKVSATATRYGLGFQFEDTDTYRAAGAADLYVNGAAGVRFSY